VKKETGNDEGRKVPFIARRGSQRVKTVESSRRPMLQKEGKRRRREVGGKKGRGD
jgi:hypothetical protein